MNKEAFNKSMKRVGWTNLCALLFVLFISGLSHAQESDTVKTFIVSGRSVAVGEDAMSAERNVLHDAMQNAIEQMVGVLIPAESFGENFELISERITAKPQGYIETAVPTHGLSTCRARIEARAIETDTAKILAANAKEAGGSDMTENVAGKKALQRAGGLLGDYLIEQIAAKWSEK